LQRGDRAVCPLYWDDDTGHIVLLDQTRLPTEIVWIRMNRVEDVWSAIKQLKVRGAPAIGIAAAYGVYVAVADEPENDCKAFIQHLWKDGTIYRRRGRLPSICFGPLSA
jgi:methylthioribose-1-phosphate isomerase